MLWIVGIAFVAGLAWYAWRRRKGSASAAPDATAQRGGGQVDE